MRGFSVCACLSLCVWCASAEPCAGNEPEPEIAKSPFDSTAAERFQETWAKFLNRETEIENSLGMTFRLIPPGELTLGSPQDEPGRSTPREDQRDGRIDRPFYLGCHEVTQREYAAIMGTNPSNHQGKDYPVERITWNQAERFCRLLSERENVLYRLPTAAEWEFACRAGTTTPFSFGKTPILIRSIRFRVLKTGGGTEGPRLRWKHSVRMRSGSMTCTGTWQSGVWTSIVGCRSLRTIVSRPGVGITRRSSNADQLLPKVSGEFATRMSGSGSSGSWMSLKERLMQTTEVSVLID